MAPPTLRKEDYHVACIAAIPEEYAAFIQMFDLLHTRPQGIDEADPNKYEFGTIAGHNVVFCPAGRSGTDNAATAATDLRRSFKEIKFGLVVGIGGGVPSDICDIRVGDVVVAAPGHLSSGITHHDRGKQLSGEFIQLDFPVSAPRELQGAVCEMQAIDILRESKIPDIISAVVERRPLFQRPDEQYDLLFQSDYEHVPGSPTCNNCSKERLVKREARKQLVPQVHYGPIASGNQVVKSAAKRDSLRRLYGVYCVEMEAAGVMISLPSLVIRGISDYADSHKNDHWKKYAALSAAAYAKELLTRIPPFGTGGSLRETHREIGQPTAPPSRGPAIEDLLDHKAQQIRAGDWRASIVDLLKVLGLKWDSRSRQELADILQVSEGSSGSPKRNNALRRVLMGHLRVENGEIAYLSELERLKY
ncbi:nucleoside phosphorylase domain-containing protein [Aspergillus recurvatus]